MMNLYILSDPVADFWKFPKGVLKKKQFFLPTCGWGGSTNPLKLNLKSEILHGGQLAQIIIFVHTQNFL